MKIKYRNLLLKTVPYVLSIAGGITIYIICADNVHNPNMADLINNISASLLAIPVVFLLYDYSNSRISRQMSRDMQKTMSDKVNIIMFNIIMLLRQMMSVRGKLTLNGMNKMLGWDVAKIRVRLAMRPVHITQMHEYHKMLDDFVYRASNAQVFSAEQLHLLSDIAHEMMRMTNTYKFRRDTNIAAKHLAIIMEKIMDWMDSDRFSEMYMTKNMEMWQSAGEVGAK